MKKVFRKAATFTAGSAAVFCIGFAALAQTRPESAAKDLSWRSSIYTQLSDRAFPLPKPRGCFCDADCLAALQRKNSQVIVWRPRYLRPENEIRIVDLDGLKKLLLRDPKDSRPLLVNFWATWCDGCREEFPDLVKIDNDYRAKGLNFLSITLDEVADKTKAVDFLKEMKATMPVVLLNVNDPEPAIHTIDEKWDGALPATFLYDREGKIVFKYFGKIKPAELRAAIDKAVGSKQ
jgi:thiol-disulfide isomerase/thioredoxin